MSMSKSEFGLLNELKARVSELEETVANLSAIVASKKPKSVNGVAEKAKGKVSAQAH